MPRRDRPQERGAALLTVLLLVAVIAVMAGTMLERLRLSTRLAANAVAMDQARGYAYAAETLAVQRISTLLAQAQERAQGQVTLSGGWSGRPFGLPIPGGAATARVTDGGNCFNLNGLVVRTPDGSFAANGAAILQFDRLMRLLRVPNADSIARATADWMDTDDSALPGGAEDSAYRGLGYRTSGTLMADISELRAVQGVTPDAYAALRPWLCTLPLAQRAPININTLSPEQAPLLAMLLPDTVGIEQARGMLIRRPMEGYSSTDGFWNQLSLAGGATPAMDAKAQTDTTTKWFRLSIDVTGSGGELHEEALIDARTLPVRLVSRQWGDAP
jgi:general secretion pathway protein K